MRIVTRWKPLFCCMALFAVTLSAQQPDLNAPDVRQKEGGYVVRRGDSLSRIAKRYGIDWRDLQRANDLNSPNIIHAGTILRVPGLATAAAPLQFRDPDGRKTYPNFPWVEIPAGREGTVTARFDAFWENAVIVYEVSGTAAVAELLRFGTAGHHNQHTSRKLQAGKRYYFAPWHKVPDETSTSPRWVGRSRARACT